MLDVSSLVLLLSEMGLATLALLVALATAGVAGLCVYALMSARRDGPS